jgi:hypothetical protein
VTYLLHRFRYVLIAVVALALSAGLAFGAQPPGSGLTNAANHAGKTVPVRAEADESTESDEDTETDEDAETDQDTEAPSEDAGDHCATDPTGLDETALAELNHGAVVCWAAHQESWPEEFANHGAWVRSWAKKDKSTEGATVSPASTKGNGKTKDH